MYDRDPAFRKWVDQRAGVAQKEEPGIMRKALAVASGVLDAPARVGTQTIARLSGIGKSEAEKRTLQEAANALAPVGPSDATRGLYETSRSAASFPLEIGKYAAIGAIPFVGAPLSVALGAAEAAGGLKEESSAALAQSLARKAGMERTAQALTPVIESGFGRAAFDVGLGKVLEKGVGLLGKRAAKGAAEAPGAAPGVAASVTPDIPAAAVEVPTAPKAATVEAARPTLKQPKPRETPLMQPSEIEGYANYERFSADPVIQDRLKATASRFVSEVETPLRVTASDKAAKLYPGKKVGDLIQSESFDDVRKQVANEIGVKPDELVTRSASGDVLGRKDLLVVRNALSDVLDEEEALMRAKADITTTAEDLAKIEFRLSSLDAERNALFDTFTTQRTEAGRNLAALKMAAFKSNEPVAWVARAQQVAKRSLSDAERLAVIEAAKTGNKDEFFKIAGELQKSTLREKFSGLFKAGLLSAPRTYFTNVLGNATMAGLETVKEYPAVFFDRLFSAYTGQQVKTLGALSPSNMKKVSIEGAINGFDDAKRVWRGQRPTGAALDIPREVKYDTPVLNWYTQKVFRSLGAADQFFKHLAISRSLDEQARVIVSNTIDPATGKRFVGDRLAEEVANLVKRPTDEMSMRALSDAEIATFQDNTMLARKTKAMTDGLGVAGDILFPFQKTPANIATRIYEYSPLGLASQTKNLAKVVFKKDATVQRELVNALGRISVGSGAMALGYALAADGRMTGFFPDNQRDRDDWEAQGKMEGAIKVNEKAPWVQIAKYSPLGNLLQIGAAMHEMGTDMEVGRMGIPGYLAGSALAPLKSVSELPMLANVKDIIDALKRAGTPEGTEAVMNIGARSLTGAIPFSGLTRSVAAGIDPTQRETKGTTFAETAENRLRASVPGLTQTLPERVDPLGRVAERPFGMIGSLASPSQVSKDLTQEDPVRAELARTGAVVGRLERQGKESGQEFAQREKLVGATIHNALELTIAQDPQYRMIGEVPIATARMALEAFNQQQEPKKQIDVSKISDDRIRSRLQGHYLEQRADQIKTAFAKARVSGLSPEDLEMYARDPQFRAYVDKRTAQTTIPSSVKSAMEAIVR